MLKVGQVIAGKYRLEQSIGQGAFATVWAATNVLLERPVALKILAEAPARKASTVERFLKEARICSQPIHPAIVSVQDLGQTEEGLPFLVMELLDGHSLDWVLRSKGALPWAMVVEMSRHVVEGLAAAHAREIIHRDIKPSNLFLVKPSCLGPPVRVLDLGLARDLGDEKRLTRTGQVVGTANYLPPETLLDESPKGGSKSGDVFALGMVMFVSLTGRFPFSAETQFSTPAAEVYARAKFYKSRSPLPGPADYDPSLPQPIDQVVRQALAVSLNHRFAHAGEMADALHRALDALAPPSARTSFQENLAETRMSPPPSCEPEGSEFDVAAWERASTEAWEALLGFGRESPANSMPQGFSIPPEASPPPPGASQAPRSTPPALRSSRPSNQQPRESRSSAPQQRATANNRGRSRLLLILLGAGLGALVSVLLLTGVALLVHSTQQREATTTAEPATVDVQLVGVPEGAQVQLDQQPVEGAVVRGTSGSTSTLKVNAPGWEPLHLPLTFESSKVLDLSQHLRRPDNSP